MTGKAYYLTTLGDWQRHAARLANSHWLALGESAEAEAGAGLVGNHCESGIAAGGADAMPPGLRAMSAATRILVGVEADEGAHLALENDPAFQQLPHPLSQKSIGPAAQATLASLGVELSATTFDAAEAAARVHPLLRYRLF